MNNRPRPTYASAAGGRPRPSTTAPSNAYPGAPWPGMSSTVPVYAGLPRPIPYAVYAAPPRPIPYVSYAPAQGRPPPQAAVLSPSPHAPPLRPVPPQGPPRARPVVPYPYAPSPMLMGPPPPPFYPVSAIPPPGQVPGPPPPLVPLPEVDAAQLPQYLGRRTWEQGLGQALQEEAQHLVLSVNKHGVSLRVFRRKGQEEGKASPSAPVSDEWSEDNTLAVDLGVVTIQHPVDEVEGEEGGVEELVPKGYEDAPPVLLPVDGSNGPSLHAPPRRRRRPGDTGDHHQPPPPEENREGYGDDGDEHVVIEDRWTEEGVEEEEEEEEKPSVVAQFIKIHNASNFAVAVTEVTILPQDGPEAKVWLEVKVAGTSFSSRNAGGATRPSHDVGDDRDEGGGGATASKQELIIEPKQGKAVEVVLNAQQDADIGCVSKYVILHFRRPSIGFVYDSISHQFLIARRVIASVVDHTAHSLLSVEAKPFIPRELREFFDQTAPGKVWPVWTSPHAFNTFRPRQVDRLLATLPGTEGRDAFRTVLQAYRKTAPQPDPYSFFNVCSEPSTMSEYVEALQKVLYLEELQAEADIKHYDLFNLNLQLNTDQALNGVFTTTITVPGASEQRPNVAYGDLVRIRPSKPVKVAKRDCHELLAMVLKTKENRVTLVLPATTPMEIFEPPARFHCRFSYNVTDFRVLHHALSNLPDDASRFIFPSFSNDKDGSSNNSSSSNNNNNNDASHDADEVVLTGSDLSFVNDHINEEQRQAVLDVVNGSHGPAPYIIFGPPGTGKTLTVIESIVQLCRVKASACILACAPSDTAADIICDRLADHMGTDQLFRLNWWQRKLESLPPRLLAYSCWDREASVFTIPSPPVKLRDYKVIVSTCASAGLLSLLARTPPGSWGAVAAGPGLDRGSLLQELLENRRQQRLLSFSHIVVDESSQAQQAEVLVPGALASADTALVLSGDPKQLGPTVRSALANALGLNKSLQEHLMTSPLTSRLYDPINDADAFINSLGAADGTGRLRRRRCITSLRRNYRSHRDIIEVPSRLFYEGRLLECGDSSITTSMVNWELLAPPSPAPRTSFASHHHHQREDATTSTAQRCPLLFYGVVGEDLHELDSPSFFNPVEASNISELVQALLTSKKVTCKTSDVGIISAFRKQVLKLRSLLREKGLGAINTGQVEDFQGQEQKVIIISTVLSSSAGYYNSADLRQQLGFLGHPKRFNVAVTRAKALTVMVGNPFILFQDPCWRALLEFCVQNGAYRGCSCPLLGMHEDEDNLDSVLDSIASLSLLGPGSRANTRIALPDSQDAFSLDSGWRIML